MELILYIVIGILIGAVVGWLIAKAKTISAIQLEKDAAQQKFSELEKEIVGYKATVTSQLQMANENLDSNLKEIAELKQTIKADALTLNNFNNQLSTANADLRAANQTLLDKNASLEAINEELKVAKNDLSISNQALATAKANNEALNEKLQTQRDEMEALGKKFNTEFENIANKILETKSERFTELNKSNLTSILEPLGKNITEFKTKVEEVYDKESKERFSLGERVKELAQLNKVISEEAHNLTKALKSESKTQGGWGEMILENILERSGLVKNREYFMEHQLMDENGKPMKSDSEDKKMRPDAVIKYPDNRNVIIDSKVSLNAFTRCIAAMDEETRVNELSEHISCIKKHIISLSAKGYDDYNKSLDFVMMFIPSEPAYIAALQGDPDLWNFAYDKRILLLSPTNLITSLKLIVDLWKREYQNQNALEIAERGAKLYDKFVGFVANLDDVGEHLEKAQGKYAEAYKQLSTGNDNLVLQATKLKCLGLKTKKELPKEIVNTAIGNELPEQINE
jgi:DNA recombination protein RmuC